MAKLTPKQKKFADKYMETGNGVEAAKEAYNLGGKGGTNEYHTAGSIASENLKKPAIKKYIEENTYTPKDKEVVINQLEEESVVYFIKCKETGLIKIGYTTDITKRVSGVRKDRGNPVELLGTIKKNGRQLEQILHIRFMKSRHKGEWFNPTEDLVDFVNTVCQIK